MEDPILFVLAVLTILGTPGNAYKRKNCRPLDGEELPQPGTERDAALPEPDGKTILTLGGDRVAALEVRIAGEAQRAPGPPRPWPPP